ncbi:MAG: leucine-rich repeat domain-containing protein [Firmicutes bacterium]|nr:leucine-rich repeat domain-containing protein [Bacillota bacterium]
MKFKNENDYSGYGIASDGRVATILSFSDRESTHITIPSHYQGVPIVKIGFGAFKACDNIRVIKMPDTIRYIESAAFRSCPNLEKVVCSKSTESIAPYAFAGCPELRSITIPSSIRALKDKAFEKCRKLTEFNVWDMNKDDGSYKYFVVASINEHRRFGFMNAAIIYFDNYSMVKYDEGYAVVQEFEDLFNVAEYRLFHPEQLTDYMRIVYRNEIRLSIPRLIRDDQVGRLTSAGELGIITERKIDDYIEMAMQYKGTCLAYLLELKEKKFKKNDLSFEL